MNYTPLFRFSAQLAALLLLPTAASYAAEKHVHGEANLYISIDKQTVLIEFESPADNIIGFEHKPKTKKQAQMLKNSINTLQYHASIVDIGADQCQQSGAEIQAPYQATHIDNTHENDHEHHDEEHHDHEKEEHHDHEHHDHEKEEHHDDEHHDHEKEEHHDNEHHDHEKAGHDEHSEFNSRYTLKCKNTKDIKQADVTAFAHFSDLSKITVHWLTEEKQSSVVLSPSQHTVKF